MKKPAALFAHPEHGGFFAVENRDLFFISHFLI